MTTMILAILLVTAEPYGKTPRVEQPRSYEPTSYGVFDERGRRSGYVREDPFVRERLNVYDSKGRKQGTIEKERR